MMVDRLLDLVERIDGSSESESVIQAFTTVGSNQQMSSTPLVQFVTETFRENISNKLS